MMLMLVNHTDQKQSFLSLSNSNIYERNCQASFETQEFHKNDTKISSISQ
jgi:hypothetical protein